MAKGVLNPYYKPPPKKDRPSIYDREPVDTESEIGVRPVKTRLDGDRFVIEFTGIEFENLQKELISLVLDIAKHHREGLNRHGIKVNVPSGNNEMSLETTEGTLTVFVGSTPNENTIVNRLGYALTQLPVQGILDKHRVAIIMRG